MVNQTISAHSRVSSLGKEFHVISHSRIRRPKPKKSDRKILGKPIKFRPITDKYGRFRGLRAI